VTRGRQTPSARRFLSSKVICPVATALVPKVRGGCQTDASLKMSCTGSFTRKSGTADFSPSEFNLSCGQATGISIAGILASGGTVTDVIRVCSPL
jgi:hypothetical protein